jgi:hypothetical protein
MLSRHSLLLTPTCYNTCAIKSWYQVEHPRHRQGLFGRDAYSEDGDRHSDGTGAGGVPVHFISESSRVDSPIPAVHRQGTRLYEQFAATSSSMPAQTSPPPASVTRLDLHDDASENYEGFDRLRRRPSSHSHASYPASSIHHCLSSGGHRRSQRRPHQPPFQQVCLDRSGRPLLIRCPIEKF